MTEQEKAASEFIFGYLQEHVKSCSDSLVMCTACRIYECASIRYNIDQYKKIKYKRD